MPYGSNALTLSTANVTSTAAGQVLAANANRRYALFQNNSTANTIWLGFSTAVPAVGAGVALNPSLSSGGVSSYEMSINKGNLTVGAVTAIASATTSVGLIMLEGV